MSKRIYLDLDGVMADFDRHFHEVFGLDHRSMADDDMWYRINAHPSYFRDMPMCDGASGFWDLVSHLDPIILTACPRTNYQHAAVQKREWCREHLGPDVDVLPVMGGHNKWLFMHNQGDILIDDYEKNTKPWVKAGGIGIVHLGWDSTIEKLSNLVDLMD